MRFFKNNKLIFKSNKVIKIFPWILYCINIFFFFFLIPWIKKKVLKKSWESTWKDWKRFSRWALKIHNIKVQVINPFNVNLDRPYIIIANHRSWFELPILCDLLPKPFHALAKSDYFNWPVFGWGLKVNQALPVQWIDGKKRLTKEDHNRAISSLKKSYQVLLFPEGTRGEGSFVLPFKSGAFRMSVESGVPILPLYLLGTENILLKNQSPLEIQSENIICIIGIPKNFYSSDWKLEKIQFENRYRRNYEVLYKKFHQLKQQKKTQNWEKLLPLLDVHDFHFESPEKVPQKSL